MAALDTRDIIPPLEKELGDFGIDYFNSQLEILRIARGLPKDIDDEFLLAPKFFLALNLIEKWIAPLQFLVDLELSELENSYRENQNQLSFLLNESKTISWAKALTHENVLIPTLIKEIFAQKEIIDKKRLELMTKSTRLNVTNLLGLMLYPHDKGTSLNDSIANSHEKYYGPNAKYRKNSKYTDALIFVKSAMDVFHKTKALPKTAEGDEFGKVFRAHRGLKEMEEIEDLYRDIKMTGDFLSDGLNMRQLNFIFSRVLQRSISPAERGMFNSEPFYIDSKDKYRIDKTMEWVMLKLYGPQDSTQAETSKSSQKFKDTQFLLGLTILDKHKNTETLGNLPTESLPVIEALLSIFHELKQSNSYAEAIGFELTEQIFGIPEQAWLYDFSGVKSEILRSTMLLVSDKVPKFDLLEACQRFSTEVLSSRVDRNDLRVRHLGGKINNYIQTNLLPRDSWDFIGESMMRIIEEVLIHEENVSRKIIKQIFAEEDRSHLVTSKKFQPVFMNKLTFENKKDTFTPKVITIHARPDFEFQYRHAQNGGYPWYFDENELIRKLLEISMGKKDIPKQVLQLKKVITNIDGKKFIFYYEVAEPVEIASDIYEVTVTTLAFKEVPEFTEGITPVEVLFRPKKFINKSPKDNGFELLLELARATDPKDLESMISNL